MAGGAPAVSRGAAAGGARAVRPRRAGCPRARGVEARRAGVVLRKRGAKPLAPRPACRGRFFSIQPLVGIPACASPSDPAACASAGVRWMALHPLLPPNPLPGLTPPTPTARSPCLLPLGCPRAGLPRGPSTVRPQRRHGVSVDGRRRTHHDGGSLQPAADSGRGDASPASESPRHLPTSLRLSRWSCAPRWTAMSRWPLPWDTPAPPLPPSAMADLLRPATWTDKRHVGAPRCGRGQDGWLYGAGARNGNTTHQWAGSSTLARELATGHGIKGAQGVRGRPAPRAAKAARAARGAWAVGACTRLGSTKQLGTVRIEYLNLVFERSTTTRRGPAAQGGGAPRAARGTRLASALHRLAGARLVGGRFAVRRDRRARRRRAEALAHAHERKRVRLALHRDLAAPTPTRPFPVEAAPGKDGGGGPSIAPESQRTQRYVSGTSKASSSGCGGPLHPVGALGGQQRAARRPSCGPWRAGRRYRYKCPRRRGRTCPPPPPPSPQAARSHRARLPSGARGRASA